VAGTRRLPLLAAREAPVVEKFIITSSSARSGGIAIDLGHAASRRTSFGGRLDTHGVSARTEQQILADIDVRRRAGIADLGAELKLRIRDLGDMALDTPARQEAFREVFDAFTPPRFDLFAMPDECAISTADNTIRISGVLVDAANRQCVGPVRRTLVLDFRFASHDYMSLQQFYRNNALAPVLLTQAFTFYDSVGILVVFAQAALETGRWYWARLGFEFFRASERAAVARWGRAVVAALGNPVDTGSLHEARQWALLGSTPPQAQTSFEAIANALPRSRYKHFARLPIRRYLELVAERNRIRFDQDIDLGRAIMLTGPDWYGYFPLYDRARRNQLNVYTNTRLRQLTARAGGGAAP
jgi:hypothetical protein